MNCPNNIVDGVYSGHTLEHLYPNHAYRLLVEIYRVLKSNCWLRINVPDLKRAIDIYNGKAKIDKVLKDYFKINSLTKIKTSIELILIKEGIVNTTKG